MPRQLVRDFGTALRMGSTTSATVSGTTPTVTTGVTICAWVNSDLWISKYPGSATARIVRTTDDNIDLFVRQTGPNLEWKLTTTQGSSPRPTANEQFLSPHKWHFVVCEYTGTTADMYIDNVLNANSSQSRDSTSLISNNTWSVGDTGGTAAFQGMIDEVSVFNFAFTTAQRTAAFYQSTYPNTGKVFYYKLDEGAGTSLTDSSGNSKTGTLTLGNGSWSTDVAFKPRSAVGTTKRNPAVTFKPAEGSPDITGHNGVTTDGTYIYTLGDPNINKYLPSANWAGAWTQVAANASAASQAGCAHLGGATYYNGFIYAAGENYTSPVQYDHQRIAIFNASDLSFVSQTDISAQTTEVSGLAIDVPRQLIYISSYVQSNIIQVYDLNTLAFVRSIYLSRSVDQTQDIAYKNNSFYLAENITNRVYKADMSGHVLGEYIKGTKTNEEGVDYTGPYLLTLDEQNTQQIVWKCIPVPARRSLNGNLIYNGDFSRQPAVNSNPTTSDDRWIDGTTTESYIAFGMDCWYGWATNNAAFASGAQFDASKGYNAMHISSINAGANMEVAPYRSDTAVDRIRYGIPVNPSTSYTLTYSLETTYTSGDSSDGAYMYLRQYNNQGTTVTTTNASTKVKTATSKTTYTLTITTGATTQYIAPVMTLVGNSGTGTLIMDAWFSSLQLNLTTPITRTAVT